MAAAKAIVLDASAILQLVIPDSEAARQRAERLILDITAGRIVAHVPVLFLHEVASACARAVRGRRLDRPSAEAFFALLGDAPLGVQVEIMASAEWFERSMKWACQVADSAYLALALGMKVPIATTDKGLMTAARTMKVPLHAVSV